MKLERLVTYGAPDLIPKATRMFEFFDGGVNFTGVGVGSRCVFFPKTGPSDKLCRLRLCCVGTGEELETCGYVAESFVEKMSACQRGRSSLTIAGKKMSRRGKPGFHEYFLEVELLDETRH